MADNPRRLNWTAPTENTDGTAIDYELNYNLLVDGQEVASFPGTLNPNGQYEMLFADLAYDFELERTYTIALTAFSVANPERESAPSASIDIRFFKIPNPPFNLVATE